MQPVPDEFDADRNVPRTDAQLVRQTLGGNRKAFDELIRKYQRQSVAVAYRLTGNTQDALEITQEAFLKAYSNLATLQTPEAFGGWLLRIVSNLSLNFRRGRKTRAVLPMDDLLGSKQQAGSEWMSRDAGPMHRLASAEMGKRLQQALKQLPEKQRLAIVMFTIEQLPQKQIAVALKCSVEAVKWHVFQGRRKLKEFLKDYI